jgi:radical SAM protein with 4Fe4S-binding SPASM domain
LIDIVGPEKVTAKITMQRDAYDIVSLVEPLLQIGVTKSLITPIVNSSHYCRGEVNFTSDDYQQMLERDNSLLFWYANEINSKPDLKIQPYHKLLSILYHSLSIAQFCLAGVKLFCVYPNGDIYPCHRFSGEKDILLGNITKLNTEIISFKDSMMQGKEEKCESCYVKHICWGNKCLQQNKIRGKKLFGINDPLFCKYHEKNLAQLLHSLSLISTKDRERSLWLRETKKVNNEK